MKIKHVEKFTLLLLSLAVWVNSPAQSQRQIFTFYDNQGKAYKVQTKQESAKETLFMEVFLAGKNIRLIKKSTAKENDTVCIRYDYLFAPHPDSTLQDESHFLKRAISRKINANRFKIYESWLYYYVQDTIRQVEIYEPLDLSQKRVFTYSPSEAFMRGYFVKNGQTELYAEQSIHISESASVFESLYNRWENATPYFYKFDSDYLTIYDDSTDYADIRFHYWNNTFSTKMETVMTGEGPIYSVDIKKFQDELIATKYKCATQELIENRILRNPDSTLSQIDVLVNNKPTHTIKVSYKH